MNKKQQFITQAQYAKRKGWTRQFISKLVSQDKIPTRADGRIDPHAADEALAAIRDKVKQKARPTLVEAQVRNLIAQAEMRELRLAFARGDAVSITDVERGWSQLISNMRARLLQVAPKLAVFLAGCSSKARCREAVQAEIYAALSELAEHAADDIDLSSDRTAPLAK